LGLKSTTIFGGQTEEPIPYQLGEVPIPYQLGEVILMFLQVSSCRIVDLFAGVTGDTINFKIKVVRVGHVGFLHHSPFISPHALKVNGKDINRLGLSG